MNTVWQFRGCSWVILAMLVLPGLSGPLAAAYSGGDGTSNSPYQLSTPADLATLVNTSADWGKWFILAADLNMQSTPLATPIGNRVVPFTGVFDGAGHSITGLVIDDTTATSKPLGLFGVADLPGLIERLRLIAPSVKSGGNASMGALVGQTMKGVTIQQCSVEQGTISTPASDAAGGLIGDHGGTVRECYATASVTALGLAGGLLGRSAGTVENCAAAGSVTTLKVGTGTAAGGLLGAGVRTTMQFCVANSTSITGARVAGLAGYADPNSVLTNCVCNKVVLKAVENWKADVAGSAWCEDANNLTSQAYFAGLGWDLSLVWLMNPNRGLQLRWMSKGPMAVAKGPSGTIRADAMTGYAKVTLDGTQSTDPAGAALKYTWKCLTPGITIDSVASPTVNLRPGTYNIELTVSNGTASSAPVAITITVMAATVVPNSAPTAVIKGPAGVVQTDPATGLAKITLDGSQSSDPDQDVLKYSWRCLTADGQPAGVTIGAVANPSLSLRCGTYKIELTVNDGTVNSSPVAITVTVNTVPTAEAGEPQVVSADAAGARLVTLDGSKSFDPEAGKGQILSYSWTCATANPGSASGPAPSLVFPIGTHTVVLVVSDGIESAQDTTQVTVTSALTASRVAASPSTVGRTSTVPDVKFYLLMPAGKSVSDVDTRATITLDLNGTKIPLERDLDYDHKKYTVVACADRGKILAVVGATNGSQSGTVCARLKTGETFFGTINLNITAGSGPSPIQVFAERASYYLDTHTWR